MDTWDSENFSPNPVKPGLGVKQHLWEGEDEEEDVRDSWDQEPEEEVKEEASKQPVKKSLKKIGERFEEKERRKKKELESRKKGEDEFEEAAERELTPEEKLAEKLRQQKLQEDADLNLAKEVFGVDVLESKEDFDRFKDEIVKKIEESAKNANYAAFTEELVHSLCIHLGSADLKKIHIWLGNLHIEKTKIEKGDKGKKSKGKGKAKLRLEGDNDFNEYSAYTEDYDDFI